MAERTSFIGSEDDLAEMVSAVVDVAAGVNPVRTALVTGFLIRCSNALLSQIQQDFITKSRGGTGRDGIWWEPLKPSTIARRRLGKGDQKLISDKARNKALTPEQIKANNKAIRQRTAQYIARGMDRDKAREMAKRVTLRGQVPTKTSILGGRNVQILIDTGVMFGTLEPGYLDQPSGVHDQLLETEPGRLAVGSKSNKFLFNHFGTKRGLPARPSWPLDGDLPMEWWDPVLQAGQRGLQLIIILVARAGGRL